MTVLARNRDGYTISTDRAKLDTEAIYRFLAEASYWAEGRPLDTVTTSIEHSLCFGVNKEDLLVGFARVVTDYATFAWVCDVFVVESHRRRGLGKWLIACIVEHPDLQGMLLMLATRDAHELYRRYGGFDSLRDPGRWMARLTS
jgi:GNAT superfamily N-acetyltransferase